MWDSGKTTDCQDNTTIKMFKKKQFKISKQN